MLYKNYIKVYYIKKYIFYILFCKKKKLLCGEKKKIYNVCVKKKGKMIYFQLYKNYKKLVCLLFCDYFKKLIRVYIYI